jgi:hypothetical protein
MITFTWFDWIALFALVILLALPDPVPPVLADRGAAALPDSAAGTAVEAADGAIDVQLVAAGPLHRSGCPQVRP